MRSGSLVAIGGVVGLLAAAGSLTPLAGQHSPPDRVSTFSIVAYDPQNKEWGVGVASKYLAVGSAVPFAKAGVGAVATQAFVNVSLGPKGLEQMAAGKSAEDTLKALAAGDKGYESRQLGLVDAKGNAATHAGKTGS